MLARRNILDLHGTRYFGDLAQSTRCCQMSCRAVSQGAMLLESFDLELDANDEHGGCSYEGGQDESKAIMAWCLMILAVEF